MTLKRGSTVAVLGGGPAGSFFAIHLLRQAKKIHEDVQVTIIDRQLVQDFSGRVQELKGCNFCAGIISPRLQKELAEQGLLLPDRVICQTFTHIWIQGLWKNFPLRVPKGEAIYSVFRGTLPHARSGGTRGLDAFLLEKAVQQGATLMAGEARAIEYGKGDRPVVTITRPGGDVMTIEPDFACICTGMNADPSLFESYRKINPLFERPKVRPALIIELKPGRLYLKKYMNNELYIIVTGSKDLDLDHTALIPKGEYLTLAFAGKSIDQASFPADLEQIVRTFLSLPHIQQILPLLERAPIACFCTPSMAVAPARAPFSHRIAVAGDALGSRLYRDGIFSAFVATRALAKTVLHTGVDKKSLSSGYGWVAQWLKTDNRYGTLIIGMMHTALKSPFLSRVLYQTFATEMKFKKQDKWPMGSVLWKIGSGAADYRDMFRQLFCAPVFFSVLTGFLNTLRNVLTEIFFGLNWEAYGRHPTVIIKEKRNYIKDSISRPLGITLDTAPEMERMYAIKIRASGKRIFRELGKFGHASAKFLRLRFVDVKRVSGLPNQAGAVVRYRLGRLPVSLDIRLIQSLPDKALVYSPAGLFVRRGMLIFDITPTRDGNNRLVIYTGFDFKKGRGPLGRLFWTLFKRLFPAYAHDVVWNHAICCIKGEAEKKG